MSETVEEAKPAAWTARAGHDVDKPHEAGSRVNRRQKAVQVAYWVR